MSNRNTVLIWDLPLPMTRKFVLMAIADQGNDEGLCFCKPETIERRCSMSRRTVFESLAELEHQGWIARKRIPGTQKVGTYLNIEKLRQLQLSMPADMDYPPTRKRCASRTGAPSAPIQDTSSTRETDEECASRTGAAGAPVRQLPENGAPAALHKATKSNSGGGCARAHTRTREEARSGLTEFDRNLIDPYLHRLPLDVSLEVFSAFVRHRNACRRPISISGMAQLAKYLDDARAAGWNLDKSLEAAMAMGYALPADPALLSVHGAAHTGPPKRNGARANDDFSSADYSTGVDPDETPAFLRSQPATG